MPYPRRTAFSAQPASVKAAATNRAYQLTILYLWACKRVLVALGEDVVSEVPYFLTLPLRARANECHRVMEWCQAAHQRTSDPAQRSVTWTPGQDIPERTTFYRMFKSLGITKEDRWSDIADKLEPRLTITYGIYTKVPGCHVGILYQLQTFRNYKRLNLKDGSALPKSKLQQMNKYNTNILNKNKCTKSPFVATSAPIGDESKVLQMKETDEISHNERLEQKNAKREILSKSRNKHFERPAQTPEDFLASQLNNSGAQHA